MSGQENLAGLYNSTALQSDVCVIYYQSKKISTVANVSMII